MIENLKDALNGTMQPGLPALRQLLEKLLNKRRRIVQFLAHEPLQADRPRVYRLRFSVSGEPHSVVVKRMEPGVAERNELLIKRWLPGVGMAGFGPALLGTAADPKGRCVWHVYEDLGDLSLDGRAPDRAQVKAAVDVIAQIHARFAGHTLLPEVRNLGNNLGASYFTSSVHEAIRGLELLRARIMRRSPRYVALCDRLLEELYAIRDEQSWRTQAVAELGGTETLLHGDLSATNTFVLLAEQGFNVRIIDWDRTAVGPTSWDLSTFLLRFPRHSRTWIFDLYAAAMKQAGWRMPSWREFNLLSEICEYARLANDIIWPTISIMKDKDDQGFERLEEIGHRFDDLNPILPQRYDFETVLAAEPA